MTLASFNAAPPDEAVAAMLSCCASRRFASAMAAGRPYPSLAAAEAEDYRAAGAEGAGLMTVSTHVPDATRGAPAAGVSVSLACRSADGWLAVESGETGADGRHRFGAVTEPGVYRLTFGTGGYFAARGVAAFYPEVAITFTVAAGHCHVPLLLSPFAYSTYRGS